jgi:peptide/nickel transport system permease protein
MTEGLSPAPARRSARAIWRNSSTGFRVGVCLLAVHVVTAVLGPFVAPYGYAQIGAGLPLSGMSLEHPMGVDQLGRDVFSRVLHGAHIVILLSLSGTALGLVVGATIGLLSAYLGGILDEFIQRCIEAVVSIPYIVLGLLAVYAAGPVLAGRPEMMVVVVAILYAPRIARMARAAALDVVTRDFVVAARLRGDRARTIIWRDLAPNTASTLLVEFALRTGYAPALIAAFGFLGFGVQPPTPEWGLMINENRNVILISPVTVLGPGLALASLVVAVNLTAEGMARMLGRSTKLDAG